MSWMLLVLGAGLAALGTALAVGTFAVSRLELSRWISQRLHGAELATTLLSAPGRVLGPANAVMAGGVLLAGLGAGAVLAPVRPVVAGALLLASVPLFLMVVHTMPRAAGRRWAAPLVRTAAPWLEHAARVMRPVMPAPRGARHAEEAPREEEIAVIAGVLAFTERPVREVMTPRTEIVAIEESATAAEAGLLFTESGYSRLPVYRESLDHIIGMAYVFDLLKVAPVDPLRLRPVMAVPESRRCTDLLFEMQRERRQFAVVLDEFGGTAGIVTLEDLLEELVGEIFDETDAGALGLPEHELLEVDGTVPAQDVAARFGTSLPGGETVGGVLATALGRIPVTGDRIVLAGLEFDILRASPTRVERVLVRHAGTVPITVPTL